MAEETREFETDSFVRGYHVYWTPVIGEQLVSRMQGRMCELFRDLLQSTKYATTKVFPTY